jgi:hypothetical protein
MDIDTEVGSVQIFTLTLARDRHETNERELERRLLLAVHRRAVGGAAVSAQANVSETDQRLDTRAGRNAVCCPAAAA